jgi:beta-lactam-binding protein with PASTA domain
MKSFSELARPTAPIATAVVSLFLLVGAPVASASGQGSATCLVPNLIGLRLRAAKHRLVVADCRIGRVKKVAGASAVNGEVIAQGRKPGKILPPRTRVSVVLDG